MRQGGYFNYDVTRRDSASAAIRPSSGWYLQASWVLTGEAKPYNPERGSLWLAEAERSVLVRQGRHRRMGNRGPLQRSRLELQRGPAGARAAIGGIRGGEQKIWTAGINWYPNSAIRFVLDYQHTDVVALNGRGRQYRHAKLDAVSLRTQLSL